MSDATTSSLVEHMDNGGQLQGLGQWLYRSGTGYFLTCDDGCCDTRMTLEDVRNYLDEPSNWTMIDTPTRSW